jgi:hypothetical protein
MLRLEELMTRLWLLGGVLVPLSACGLLGKAVDHTVGSCDLRDSNVTHQAFCQEWRGLIKAPGSNTTETGLCATLGSTFVEDECPDSDAIVGGCYMGKLGDGSASYQWYYSTGDDAMTAEDAQAACDDDEGTFVLFFPFDVDASDFGPPDE